MDKGHTILDKRVLYGLYLLHLPHEYLLTHGIPCLLE